MVFRLLFDPQEESDGKIGRQLTGTEFGDLADQHDVRPLLRIGVETRGDQCSQCDRVVVGQWRVITGDNFLAKRNQVQLLSVEGRL